MTDWLTDWLTDWRTTSMAFVLLFPLSCCCLFSTMCQLTLAPENSAAKSSYHTQNQRFFLLTLREGLSSFVYFLFKDGLASSKTNHRRLCLCCVVGGGWYLLLLMPLGYIVWLVTATVEKSLNSEIARLQQKPQQCDRCLHARWVASCLHERIRNTFRGNISFVYRHAMKAMVIPHF